MKAWAYLLHRCSHWWLLGEKRFRPSAEFVVCRTEQENRMSGRDGGQNSGWVRQLRRDSQEHVRDVCRIQSVDNGTLLPTKSPRLIDTLWTTELTIAVLNIVLFIQWDHVTFLHSLFDCTMPSVYVKTAVVTLLSAMRVLYTPFVVLDLSVTKNTFEL